MFMEIIYSFNTLTARYIREWLAISEYDLTIPVGLLKCIPTKRVTHERRKGVLLFKVA
jgi:hypothetical protein